jgi:Fe-S-cluster containining protein
MLTRSEALRLTLANPLKQLAFLNAEHLKGFLPKRLNVVHKTLFTSLSMLPEMDMCPCGSGKRYGDCCGKKGITYGVFEYGKARVVFDIEQTNRAIENLLSFLSAEVFGLYDQGAQIDLGEALEKLHVIYEMFAKSLAPFSEASFCREGCTACCHHIIETTPIEAELIRRCLEKCLDYSARTSILSEIEKKRAYYPGPIALDGEYDEDLQDRHFEAHIPCPFLSNDGSCRVYESRPLVCRTYMVFSDPHQCKIGNGMAIYEAEYFPDVHRGAQCLSLLARGDLNLRRHLPDWLVNEFRIKT